MSARAAWRLETLGFTQVFRYTPGKADWAASGLPREGKLTNTPQAADVMRRDVPTCRLDETVKQVRQQFQAADWQLCVVVNKANVVLGRLRHLALSGAPDSVVEAVMEAGSTTIRPNEPLAGLAKRLRERRVDSIIVTTTDGELLGVVFRADAQARLEPSTSTSPST